jgi:glycosyltransferase involved in cell wall biosynthesis
MDSGYGIRVRNVIEGLRAAGEVHVLLVDSSDDGVTFTDGVGYTADLVRAHNPRSAMKGVRLARLLPANVRYRRPAAVRAAVRELVGGRTWDVVWCSRARVHLLTDGLVDAPQIVDFDDLNDRLLRSKIADRRERHGTLPTLPLNARDWLDAVLWSRLQRRITARVDKVVVCSVIDRARLGSVNIGVVPNGYPEPAATPEPSDAARHPRMLFVGPLTYEPNRLAVEWLVDKVLPAVRAVVPDVELVVVGDDRDVKVRGGHERGVVMTGYVPDVGPFYASATVALAPLHSGGGTRIKVIEALARSVPVVATTFGSTGHGLIPGHDLLVADDAEAFAEACVRLLSDDQLRAEIAANGRRVYEHRLTADATVAAVAAIARSAAGIGAGPAVSWPPR